MLTLNIFITFSPNYLFKEKISETLPSPTTVLQQQHIIASNFVPYLRVEFYYFIEISILRLIALAYQ